MKKADQQKYKQILLALRARLLGEVHHLADSGLTNSSGDLSSVPLHLADVGTDTYEQDFTITLMENSEEAIDEIKAALERIEEGEYGICTECSSKIPKARLDVIPYTRLCVNCKAAMEEG